MSDRPVRVALFAGIVVARDSVSWSVLHKLAALRRLQELGAPIEVTVFAQSFDGQDPEFHRAESVSELVAFEEFWGADVYIYEEGMYYELFDSVFLVPPGRPVLAIEHNSTPVELVDVPEAKAAVARSHAQRSNLTVASHVACVSELNMAMARAAGVPGDRLSVLHLPASVVPNRVFEPLAGHPGPARLLFLGRFVRAKGAQDMLELVDRLGAAEGRFSVTLAGDPRFSDPELVAAAENRATERPEGVEVVLAPDDRQLAALYERTDALVVPSYHEGYCIPVVEAYGFGRFVIAYDAGNLPAICGGLGLLVPTGDVAALEAAVRRFGAAVSGAGRLVLPTGRGDLGAGAWREALRAHLEAYSAAAFERGFLGLLCRLLAASPAGLPSRVERAVAARLGRLAEEAQEGLRATR
jgi:glycosyltransferase involved in cell wall biosynthesis